MIGSFPNSFKGIMFIAMFYSKTVDVCIYMSGHIIIQRGESIAENLL